MAKSSAFVLITVLLTNSVYLITMEATGKYAITKMIVNGNGIMYGHIYLYRKILGKKPLIVHNSLLWSPIDLIWIPMSHTPSVS